MYKYYQNYKYYRTITLFMNSNTSVRNNSKTIYEIIIHFWGGQCWIDEGFNWEFIRDIAKKKIAEVQDDRDIRDVCRFDSITICQYDFESKCARAVGVINLGFTDYEMWNHLSYYHSIVRP